MIIRLSQKLCTKVKAGKLAELPLAEDPILDWSLSRLPWVERSSSCSATRSHSTRVLFQARA